MVKRLRKLVQHIQRYSTKYAIFGRVHTRRSQMSYVNSGVTGPNFEIFTQYRGIIYAVNAYIEVAISHSVSECQIDESGEFAIFSQNSLPWQRPLRYGKKSSSSIICTQNAFIW